MNTKRPVVALVGAGRGGHALLSLFLEIPNVEVRYVYDTSRSAPGIKLARKHKIACRHDAGFRDLQKNPRIDLILEITGHQSVFDRLSHIKFAGTSLIGSGGSRFLFELLEHEKQINATLNDRVAERTEALSVANDLLVEQLFEHRVLNEKLQQVNDEKTRYLLRSTHQLKAPFAAIQSYTDIILNGYTGEIPDRTRAIVNKIKARCELLSTSIREMLELANLRSCIVENLTMRAYSVNAIIRSVLDGYRILAESRGIDIAFSACRGRNDVVCSKDQVAILLSVFVENAISYSHDDSTIEVTCRARNNKVIVAVTDHGIGISEKNREQIFNEYFRSNAAAAKRSDGTGLGLAIADEIARIHEFTIGVDSTEGEGSTFSLACPRAPASKQQKRK